MGKTQTSSKMSKKNKLLLSILLTSIVVVFCLLGILLYINYYIRVNVVLTTISRYKDGDIKNVSEYEIINIKKGRNLDYLPSPYLEGYTFGGWFFDQACKKPFDYHQALNDNVQLYGKFDLIEYNIQLVLDEEITLNYNLTQDTDYNVKYTIEDYIKLPLIDDEVQLADLSTTTIADYKLQYKEGYTFEGWGFSSTAYNTVNNTYKIPAQNMTLYAIWRPVQVEVQFCSQDLSFAENKSTLGDINRRLDAVTGGLNYENTYNVYISEHLEYNDKVASVIEPSDKYRNFEFAGWYMDPRFTVPVKFTQLYARNGYFTLTQERNQDILDDPLYFGSDLSITEQQKEYIRQFSNGDENDSYIQLFAKWIPKQYTIVYNLNLPTEDSYVDTSLMGRIINSGVGKYVYNDTGNTIRSKTNVYQGWYLRTTLTTNGVLYDEDYFKNIVYSDNDTTGLPGYTLMGWNSLPDGSGYDPQNTSDVYFNKMDFDLRGNVINLYAQWRGYNRVNYYFTNGQMTTPILLGTVNVESSYLELPAFESMVAGIDQQTRLITFTEKQIQMNAIKNKYYVPLNSTFAGWSVRDEYNPNNGYLYTSGYEYKVGKTISLEEGIYINGAYRYLYTGWINNTNFYQYDMGEKMEDVIFGENGQSLKRQIYNEDGSYIDYEYTGLRQYTLDTISDEKFLATKKKLGKGYSLGGWTLKDGTEISGEEREEIRFNAYNTKFIDNSVVFEGKNKDLCTNVILKGKVEIDRGHIYTVYNEDEDKSVIWIRVNSVKKVILSALWLENIVLSFDAGVPDALWKEGYSAEQLKTSSAGSVYVTMPVVKDILSRPYYDFVGWAMTNREGSEIINYNDFIDNNTLYKAGERYELFGEDTTMYAVWRPIVYTLNVYQYSKESVNNYSSARVFIAKEKVVVDNQKATNEIVLQGNTITYVEPDGTQKTVLLTTSAVAGYGLSGWATSNGLELIKQDTNYKISVKDDINGLFVASPTTNADHFASIYPLFDILKYDVTFVIEGEGITDLADNVKYKTHEDVEYGTTLRKLMPIVMSYYYKTGYTYKGWNISGDVDNYGYVKEDYILDLNNSSMIVKSDLVVTLSAEKLAYSVRFSFTNPETNAISQIITYSLDYLTELSTLSEEIEEKIDNEHTYLGYNFDCWQSVSSGLSNDLEGFDGIVITAPLELVSKYVVAPVNVEFKYYSDNSQNADNMEHFSAASEFNATYPINESLLSVKPERMGYILKGWGLTENAEKIFKDLDQVKLDKTYRDYYIASAETGYRTYTLKLYAIWVESAKLTLNLKNVRLDVAIETEMEFEKNSTVYLNQLPFASITTSELRSENGKGSYNGVWRDYFNNTYDVFNPNTKIVMDRDITLVPIFDPNTYEIVYNYFYSGQYYALNTVDKIKEDYTTVPTLKGETEINSLLSKIANLRNYRAINYYLGRDNFEADDQEFKFALGSEFDFANVAEYQNQANELKFNFYIELQAVKTVFYYSDRFEYSPATTVTIYEGSQYVIGASDATSSQVTIMPSKVGYIFKGWSTSLDDEIIEFRNNDVITYTGQFVRLFPVWEERVVSIRYYKIDGSQLLYTHAGLYTESVELLANSQFDNYALIGWSKDPNGPVHYQANERIEYSEVYEITGTYELNLYSIVEHYYTISYHNNVDSSILSSQKTYKGFTIDLWNFEMTELSSKKGSTFIGWSLDNKTVITKFTINGRNGDTLIYPENSFKLNSADDYDLMFYAMWQTSSHSAIFVTTNNDGTTYIQYGKNDNTLTATETKYDFDDVNQYTYTFPNTANSYVMSGQEYKFTGLWTDGTSTYENSVTLKFDKDYVFTPVYEEVYSLAVNDGTSHIFETKLSSGEVFNFNNSKLIEAIETINLGLTDQKVVGLKHGLDYYWTNASNPDLLVFTKSFETSITMSNSYVLSLVIADIITVKVYKDVNSSLQFEGLTTINEFVLGGSINLDDYSKSGDYETTGFVMTESDYNYNPNADVVTGNIKLTKTNVTGKTVYFYALLKAKVTFAINNVIDDNYTQFVTLGKTPSMKELENSSEFEYYTGWLVDGEEYENTPITEPTAFNTFSRPFFQLQVAQGDAYIANTVDLIRGKLKLDTVTNLPSVDEVLIKPNYASQRQLVGWNLAYAGQFVMAGENRKQYLPNAEITIETILTALGVDSDNISSVAVEMYPVYEYITHALELVASPNVSYTYTLTTLTNAPLEETIAQRFLAQSEFSLLSESSVTTTDSTLSFRAYLKEDDKIVYSGGSPIVANVLVTRVVDVGYTSNYWYYANTTTQLSATFNITSDIRVVAQVPTANQISFMAQVYVYDNGNYLAVDNNNYATYKDIAHLDSDNGYTLTKSTLANQPVIFNVFVKNGYSMRVTSSNFETITNNIGTSVNGDNNRVTCVVAVNTTYYVVIEKGTEFSPEIKLNTSNIADYDISKIDSAIFTLYSEAGGWQEFGRANLSDFTNGVYRFANKLAIASNVKVVTALDSKYYYVSSIVVDSQRITNYTTEGLDIPTTDIFDIEIVLGVREYIVKVLNDGVETFSSEKLDVKESYNFSVETLSKTGYIQSGYQIKFGQNSSANNIYSWINADTTLVPTEIMSETTAINEAKHVLYIVLNVVWVPETYTLIVSADADKAHIFVNGRVVNQANLQVTYNETININNSIITYVKKTFRVDEKGNIITNSENMTIVVTPINSYVFDGFDFATTNVTGDTTITANFVPGDISGVVSVVDNVTGEYENKNITLGTLYNAGENFVVSYNSAGNIQNNSKTYNIKTNENITLNFVGNDKVRVEYDVIVGEEKLSDYAFDAQAFKNATNVNLTISNNEITINNCKVDGIEIVYNIYRQEYNNFIQIDTASEETLQNVYNSLAGGYIVKLDEINISDNNKKQFSTLEYREKSTYTLIVNSGYFDFDAIYYMDNGVKNYVYNSNGSISDCLSSFDSASGLLTVVGGGLSGNDLEFHIELKLKGFNVVFHSPEGIYSAEDDYSGYGSAITPNKTTSFAYGDSVNYTMSELFRPTTNVINDMEVEFSHWTFYNGNYDAGNVDSSKYVKFESVSWTFNTNGNLHLFANFKKLFDVNFIASNDQFSDIEGAEQTGLPASVTGQSINNTLSLNNLPARNGFTFAGYVYNFKGSKYILGYNNGYSALVLHGETVETMETFDASAITLGMIITSEMHDVNTLFDTINFTPIWVSTTTNLTLSYDSVLGEVVSYKYASDYSEGSFDIFNYDVITPTQITINGTSYDALVVSGEDGIRGAYIVKPNTAEYYKFSHFEVGGEKLTSALAISSATIIEVQFVGDFVPYVINLTWDESQSSDEDYTLEITGASETNIVKVEAFDSSIDYTEEITSSYSKSFTKHYSKIVLYTIKGSDVDYLITLNNGYETEIEGQKYSAVGSVIDNNQAGSIDYKFTLRRVNLTLNSYMFNDLDNKNGNLNFKVMYYAPISGETITDYDNAFTEFTSTSGNLTLNNIVYGTKIYFESATTGYSIISLKNGTTEISKLNSDGSNYYILATDINDIKVVYNETYTGFNFSINGVNYASAFFKPSEDTTPNAELIAFVKLITYGYDFMYSGGGNLDALFDNVSLNGTSNSTVKSKIVKDNSGEPVYYTEGDFVKLFNYPINQNISKLYSNDTSLKNVWFENWSISGAYPSTDNVTLDTMYVVSGVNNVTIVAEVSESFIFHLEVNYESLDNASANGGVTYLETGASSDYHFEVTDNSVISCTINDVDYYGILEFRTKSNTYLPALKTLADRNSYIIKNADEYSRKVISTNINAIVELGLKQITITTVTVEDDLKDITNDFEGIKTINMSANYLTTIVEILAGAELKLMPDYEDATKSYYYVFEGVYCAGNKLVGNDLSQLLGEDGALASYEHGSEIQLTIKYTAVEKSSLIVNVVERNDFNNSYLTEQRTLYVVKNGTTIAELLGDEIVYSVSKNQSLSTNDEIVKSNILGLIGEGYITVDFYASETQVGDIQSLFTNMTNLPEQISTGDVYTSRLDGKYYNRPLNSLETGGDWDIIVNIDFDIAYLYFCVVPKVAITISSASETGVNDTVLEINNNYLVKNQAIKVSDYLAAYIAQNSDIKFFIYESSIPADFVGTAYVFEKAIVNNDTDYEFSLNAQFVITEESEIKLYWKKIEY